MDLRVSHDTEYRYAQPVHGAHHIAHLSPPDTVTQQVLSHDLTVTPMPEADTWSQRQDAFGNHVVQWQTVGAHEALRVQATSTVRTWALPPVDDATCGWAQAAEHYAYQSAQANDPAAAFTFASTHVPKAAAFADYAASSFSPDARLVDAALDLLRRMDQDFSYVSQSTTIHTPALAALQARRGVCQDFAHIMLACLRSLGLAARYVSGYLLTEVPEGQVRLRGSDASHAWVALHVPGLDAGQHAWLHLDPTNHRSGWGSPGPDYVTLACGRDFADVSPLRGVLQGGAAHTLRVGVTVEPLSERPSAGG
jgi:transglutaminase-like putative cysteine protease